MKYLFILGRNPELSIAEIRSYFKKIENKIIKFEQNKNSLLIECEKKIESIINNLGGTIAIGEVLCFAEPEELERQEIYLGTKNNIVYVIWDFTNEELYNKISEYLKKRFKIEKLKATQKNLTGNLELQDGKYARIASGLIDEEYFVFDNYFGKIIEKCDYKSLESRDMGKPFRREELSISPRLAKIMINLSEVKEREKLLDPFCGIGVILLETLFQKIRVIGIDNDSDAIDKAMKNIEWERYSKEHYELIAGDSRKVVVGNANVIVTEPHLGELLKRILPEKKADTMIKEYENLIIDVLNNLKKFVSGKIVFTAPLIKTRNKRVSCDVEKITAKTRLKLANGFPIQEYRESQIIGREIFVLNR